MSIISRFNEKYSKFLPLIFLLIVFFMFLKLLNPIFFSGQINHDAPKGYMASDAYWILANVDETAKTGLYLNIAPVLVDYSTVKYTIVDPPLFIYYSASISNILGIKSYDGVNVSLLLLLGSVLIIAFLILYELKSLAALVFLPYSLFILSFPYSASFTWGFWRQYMAIAALFFSIIFLMEEQTIITSIFLGLIFSATIIGYGLYGIFFLILLFLSYILYFISFKNKFDILWKYVIIVFVGLFISLIYIFEFRAAWGSTNPTKSNLVSQFIFADYNPYGAKITFSHIHLLYLFLLGLILIFGYFFLAKDKNTRLNKNIYLICSLFFLSSLASFNLVERTFILRFLWPSIISIIFGLTAFLIFRFLLKKKFMILNALSIVIFIIISFFVWSSLDYNLNTNYSSILPDNEWIAFEYTNQNTPINSTIILIDPSLTQDTVIFGIKRDVRYFTPDNFAKMINNNISFSKANSSKFCQFPNYNLKGFKMEKVNVPNVCSPGIYPSCNFDYAILVIFNNPSYINWIRSQEFEKNFDIVKDFNGVYLLKNHDLRCSN